MQCCALLRTPPPRNHPGCSQPCTASNCTCTTCPLREPKLPNQHRLLPCTSSPHNISMQATPAQACNQSSLRGANYLAYLLLHVYLQREKHAILLYACLTVRHVTRVSMGQTENAHTHMQSYVCEGKSVLRVPETPVLGLPARLGVQCQHLPAGLTTTAVTLSCSLPPPPAAPPAGMPAAPMHACCSTRAPGAAAACLWGQCLRRTGTCHHTPRGACWPCLHTHGRHTFLLSHKARQQALALSARACSPGNMICCCLTYTPGHRGMPWPWHSKLLCCGCCCCLLPGAISSPCPNPASQRACQLWGKRHAAQADAAAPTRSTPRRQWQLLQGAACSHMAAAPPNCSIVPGAQGSAGGVF
jgi:hypothetical protein